MAGVSLMGEGGIEDLAKVARAGGGAFVGECGVVDDAEC